MKTRTRRRLFSGVLAALVLAALALVALAIREGRRRAASEYAPSDPELILCTGYCNCGTCCGWRRTWFGFGPAVYTYGKLKGQRKKVGVTATGKTAAHGTVAADVARFPFGTRLEIPGYGEGVVEDIGGSIRGRHIDLWFPTHAEAKRWGAQWLKVRTLKPKKEKKSAPPAR